MDWIFDLIIVSFLAADALVIDYLFWRAEHMFTTYFHHFFLVACMAAWIVIFYGSFVEPQRVELVEQPIEINKNGTQSVHVLLLSDMHAGRYKGPRFYQRVIDIINELNPDVVLLAGDFVMNNPRDAAKLKPLENITKVYPTYAVLGNHDFDIGSSLDPIDWDGGNAIEQSLESLGVHVLRNDGVELADGLWLAGLEEYWTHLHSVKKATINRPEGAATVVLTHNPDVVSTLEPDDKVDLVLAGHTHGGQIRLPLIGPVPQIPTQLGRKYDRGLFTINNTPTFITSGIGESGPRARLFNPPEIVSINIRY